MSGSPLLSGSRGASASLWRLYGKPGWSLFKINHKNEALVPPASF